MEENTPTPAVSPTPAVPIAEFGRDHWSTFAYLACVVVGARGEPQRSKMRCFARRHPQFNHLRPDLATNPPTRLLDGSILTEHDDWDCADDLVAAGLLSSEGTGLCPVFDLTPEGWEALRALLAHRRSLAFVGVNGFGSFSWPQQLVASAEERFEEAVGDYLQKIGTVATGPSQAAYDIARLAATVFRGRP